MTASFPGLVSADQQHLADRLTTLTAAGQPDWQLIASQIIVDLINSGWRPPEPGRWGPLRKWMNLTEPADVLAGGWGCFGGPWQDWFHGATPPAAGDPFIAYDPKHMLVAEGRILAVNGRSGAIRYTVDPSTVRRVEGVDFPVPDGEWGR